MKNLQITTRDERGDYEYYPTLPEFLATRTAADLTTALSAVLGIERHRLANELAGLQCEALSLEVENNEASAP